MTTEENEEFAKIIDTVMEGVEQRLMTVLDEYQSDFNRIVDTPNGKTLMVAMAGEISDAFAKMADRIQDYGERIRAGNV